MHLETTEILAICGTIITFFGGVIIRGVYNTVNRLENNDKNIFKRLTDIEKGLSGIQSAHDTVMQSGGHKNQE